MPTTQPASDGVTPVPCYLNSRQGNVLVSATSETENVLLEMDTCEVWYIWLNKSKVKFKNGYYLELAGRINQEDQAPWQHF